MGLPPHARHPAGTPWAAVDSGHEPACSPVSVGFPSGQTSHFLPWPARSSLAPGVRWARHSGHCLLSLSCPGAPTTLRLSWASSELLDPHILSCSQAASVKKGPEPSPHPLPAGRPRASWEPWQGGGAGAALPGPRSGGSHFLLRLGSKPQVGELQDAGHGWALLWGLGEPRASSFQDAS